MVVAATIVYSTVCNFVVTAGVGWALQHRREIVPVNVCLVRGRADLGADQKTPGAQIVYITTQDPVFRASRPDLQAVVANGGNFTFFKEAISDVQETHGTVHTDVCLAITGAF